MISVILPAYLSPYNRCAKNQQSGFNRALQSIVDQTYKDWELIVISDGCLIAERLLLEFMVKQSSEVQNKIKGFLIPKQKQWSGTIRNEGLKRATGSIITYLDSDDKFTLDHLQFISDNFKGDWVWFDDMI